VPSVHGKEIFKKKSKTSVDIQYFNVILINFFKRGHGNGAEFEGVYREPPLLCKKEKQASGR
jgi:hypothetical protein